MRFLLVLSVVIAACAASAIKDPTEGYKEGDRFFYFPGDGDDTLHLVDTQEPVDQVFLRDYARNPNYNGYWLLTRKNPTTAQILEIYDFNTLLNSNFSFKKNTVFLAHGWNGNGNNYFNRLLTQAFLEDDDVNVIVVNWDRLANRNYLTAKNGVPSVGKHVGQFINWLVSAGASYDSIHLVGFSLGGHLMGAAGRETGSQVKRITALDPAGPLWYGDSNRITENDAKYVEVIHTNTRLLGFADPCGHADFYPNGGASMPGCWTNNCSHGMAIYYMAASINHNHLWSEECGSLRDATRDGCNGTPRNPMGNSSFKKNRSGIFRTNTGSNYPF